MLGRPDKKGLAAAAAGPSWVRRASSWPVVGAAADRTWRWWFDRTVARQYNQANAPAIRAFAAAPPALDDVQRRVLRELSSTGVAIVSGEELFGGPEPLATLRREAEAWVASDEVAGQERDYATAAVAGSAKSYLVRMFGKGGLLPWESPWLQQATNPRVLDVVNSYLGMFARLNYVDVWDTVPAAREGPDVGSQRWHRDPEAPRLVKVFTYFTDVRRDSGPLIVVPHSRRGDRYGSLWPQQFPGGSHPPPDELERRIPASEWVVCDVPACTLVFADTSSFHRGGRATGTRRVLSVVNYVPPGSAWQRSFDVDRAAVPAGLSPAARSALLD